MIASSSGRIAAFGIAALLVFGGAYGVGAATGGDDDTDDATEATAGHGGGHGDEPEATGATPAIGGLSAAAEGYRLVPLGADLAAGEPGELAFTIVDDHGDVVLDYEVKDERLLHLILARDDLSAEQHVHPELDDDGTWRIDVTLPSAGRWRAIADFHPTGGPIVALAVDVFVDGDVTTSPLEAPRPVDEVDGFRVELDGEPEAGHETTVRFDVTRGGEPVDDLEPYLGALGHLVVLREGDLAYLHVHPESDDELAFAATFPSPGTYRLFLELQHDGVVRTAAFTVEVTS